MDGETLLERPRVNAPGSSGRSSARRPWAWRLGAVAGVEIYLHVSLLVILGWLFVAQLGTGNGIEHALVSLTLLVSVFAIIVVHELAHALVARRFGCKTRDITLWAIGGVASMERMPDRPRHELLVALAGPAVNIALAGLLALVIAVMGGSLDPSELGRTDSGFATKLLWVNVSLAVFNLIPAFPMDGGRVLRAILAMHGDRARATAIAARVGQRIAWGLGALGILFNPMLLVIAVFVWLGAAAEASMVQAEAALAGERVSDAMISDVRVVDRDLSLPEVARIALTTTQSVFPVVDGDGRLAGAIDRSDLVRALTASPATRVGMVMRGEVMSARTDEPLIDALRRMTASGAIVVDDRSRPVGILTAEVIAQFAAIQAALRAVRRESS